MACDERLIDFRLIPPALERLSPWSVPTFGDQEVGSFGRSFSSFLSHLILTSRVVGLSRQSRPDGVR